VLREQTNNAVKQTKGRSELFDLISDEARIERQSRPSTDNSELQGLRVAHFAARNIHIFADA
jgi:hypothetical protein